MTKDKDKKKAKKAAQKEKLAKALRNNLNRRKK